MLSSSSFFVHVLLRASKGSKNGHHACLVIHTHSTFTATPVAWLIKYLLLSRVHSGRVGGDSTALSIYMSRTCIIAVATALDLPVKFCAVDKYLTL
jgi:hypothetical protein